jgi:hypothetical protein
VKITTATQTNLPSKFANSRIAISATSGGSRSSVRHAEANDGGAAKCRWATIFRLLYRFCGSDQLGKRLDLEGMTVDNEPRGTLDR